jgi:hypothetical protein
MPETGQVVKLRLECLECAAHEYRRVRPRLNVRVWARRQQESAANVNKGSQDTRVQLRVGMAAPLN